MLLVCIAACVCWREVLQDSMERLGSSGCCWYAGVCISICSIITLAHSFSQAAEFWAESRNLPFSTEFWYLCGIWGRLNGDHWPSRNEGKRWQMMSIVACYLEKVQWARRRPIIPENFALFSDHMITWSVFIGLEIGIPTKFHGILQKFRNDRWLVRSSAWYRN